MFTSKKRPPQETSQPADRPQRIVLDEAKQSVVCALVAVGCSQRQASRYVGCSPTTIANQAKRDPEFAEQLRSARMQRELTPLRNVMAASGRSWRAGAWLLERMYPQRYVRRRPDLMTRDEMNHFARGIGRIISSEVHDPSARDRMNSEIKRLVAQFQADVHPLT